MAFNDTRWTRQTLAFNAGRVVTDQGPENGPALFSYASATDAIATVTAADYFSPAVFDLAVGDLIFIDASDADGIYLVDTVDRTAGTVTVVSYGPAGAVGTANLQDGAVTAVKLASDAVTTAKILNANVTLAKLASGIAPSHIVKYAGTANYAGGGTSTAITVTGAAATDLVFAQIQASTNAVSVVKVVPTLNTVTVHFSADPGAATVVQYQVLRVAS